MNHMIDPPQEEPGPLVDCPDCDGEGRFEYSECCGAEIINGICIECREHADGQNCEKCIGTGQVEADRPDDLF